jgi:hypothetical protein
MFNRHELSLIERNALIKMYQDYKTAAKNRGEHDVADYYQKTLDALFAVKPKDEDSSSNPKLGLK